MPEPVVGVIMGSDSDWRVMQAAAEALAEFEVPYEVGVYSAHRTPQRMLDYACGAAGRGLRVVIAGAGGAAHLPGMVAAATPLPVIGVPVPLAQLDGAFAERAGARERGERHHLRHVPWLEAHRTERGIGRRRLARPQHRAHRRVDLDLPARGLRAGPLRAVEALTRVAVRSERSEVGA